MREIFIVPIGIMVEEKRIDNCVYLYEKPMISVDDLIKVAKRMRADKITIVKENSDGSKNIKLSASEQKTLQFYLQKALIDAEGMAAIGVGSKKSVENIRSIIAKLS